MKNRLQVSSVGFSARECADPLESRLINGYQ